LPEDEAGAIKCSVREFRISKNTGRQRKTHNPQGDIGTALFDNLSSLFTCPLDVLTKALDGVTANQGKDHRD